MSKLGILASMFSVSTEMPAFVTGPSTSTTRGVLPPAEVTPDRMAGTVVGGAVAVIVVVALTLSLCLLCFRLRLLCFRLRRTSSPRHREGPGLVHHADEERGISKQIVEIERFRTLPVPTYDAGGNDSSFAVSVTNNSQDDSSYLFKASDGSDSLFDSTCSSESNSSGGSWHYRSVDLPEDPSYRSWLLGGVERMEVIEEEPEELFRSGACSTGSPESANSRTAGTDSHVYSSDDVVSFHSCSDGAPESVLDTGVSQSTNTEYRTCSERTNILNTAFTGSIDNAGHKALTGRKSILDEAFNGSSNVEDRSCDSSPRSGLQLQDDEEEPCLPGPHTTPRTSPESSSSTRSWLSPMSHGSSPESSASSSDRTGGDDSPHSGTSGEVSSGCFDLSYVTFHTLPITTSSSSSSSTEDESLQAVYACFGPSARVKSATSSRQNSPLKSPPFTPVCRSYRFYSSARAD